MVVTASGTAAAISGQGWGATASETNASNAQLPLGENLLVNTDWQESTDGWVAGWDGDSGLIITRGFDLSGWSGSPVRTSYVLINGTPAIGKVVDGLSQPVWENLASLRRYSPRITPGDRLHCSYYMGMHRCNSMVVITWFNAAGTYLSSESFNSTSALEAKKFGHGATENAERVGGFVTVPADAVYMHIIPRMVSVGGEFNPYLFHGWPMVAKVSATQTTAPAYRTGQADRYVDYTAENTAAAISGQGALATLDTITATQITAGTITASKLSVTSLDAITATIGLLRTASTGARMELESNQGRVYDSGGTLRVRWGVW